MSGGLFEYKEYIINDIVEKIEQVQVEVNTQPLNQEDGEFSYYNYVEDKEGFNLVCDTAKFYLDMAYTLSHRISYFMSGDDGEDNFKQRLVEDIDKVLEKHKEIIEVLK